jgi:hypothetical protein
LTCTFHSSAVFGKSFQAGFIDAPMIFCICGLTVVGTGSVRAGTSRAGGTVVSARAYGVKATIATAAQARPIGCRVRGLRVAKDLSIGMQRLLMTEDR